MRLKIYLKFFAIVWLYLNKKDIVVLRLGSHISSNVPLPDFKYEKSRYATTLKKVKIPNELSIELSYFMGLLTGDGTIRGEKSVRFANTNKHLKEIRLSRGQALCIEPMLTLGSNQITKLEDGTIVTADGKSAAHFEHTIYIGETGIEVLTRRQDEF